jgi:NlpC/P60 family putative phage cell wall peptidase
MTRDEIVAEAMSWKQTPYQHGQSLKGVGCDCLGLIRGVWRAVYGVEPVAIPPYSPDWAEMDAGEPLLSGLRMRCPEMAVEAAQAGDIIACQMHPGASVKHLAIMVAGRAGDKTARIIHAYWGRAVVVSWLRPFWITRAVAAFSFPEKEN